MIEHLKLIVELIGYIIWPISILILFLIFKKDIKSIIQRLKSAEIKNVKIELDNEIDDKIDNVKTEAIDHGVTMFYPLEVLEKEFNISTNLPKSHVIIETWKELEFLIRKLDERENYNNLSDSINYLVKQNKIQKYLANIVLELRELRNLAVHNFDFNISDENYQSWISISKSAIERLKTNR